MIFFKEYMHRDIQSFIKNCVICQHTKYDTKPRWSSIAPSYSIPANVWEDISLDFITGLPSSNAYTIILVVVVDRFSKSIYTLPSHFTTYKVVAFFVNIVCTIHGLPKSIALYRDTIFICRFWSRCSN